MPCASSEFDRVEWEIAALDAVVALAAAAHDGEGTAGAALRVEAGAVGFQDLYRVELRHLAAVLDRMAHLMGSQ